MIAGAVGQLRTESQVAEVEARGGQALAPDAGRTAVAQVLHVGPFPARHEVQLLDYIWSELLQVDVRRPMAALYELLSNLGAPRAGMSRVEQVSQWIRVRKLAGQTRHQVASLEQEMSDLANRRRGTR